MKTAKPTSNKPKPVPHHALSDLAMEAFAQTRVATREQAKGVIAKAQERLHNACVAELKTSVRGRAMLAMIPKGQAALDRNYGDDGYQYSIGLAEKGSRYNQNVLHLACRPKVLRRLMPKLKAVSDAQDLMRRGFNPNHRRAYVVMAVAADAKAMIKIRAIVDKCVATREILVNAGRG